MDLGLNFVTDTLMWGFSSIQSVVLIRFTSHFLLKINLKAKSLIIIDKLMERPSVQYLGKFGSIKTFRLEQFNFEISIVIF